jgi:hypothetical protein
VPAAGLGKMGILNFGFDNIELWRSEEMQLVQLMIPAESAHDTIAALGDVGLLQFKDLNSDKSAFQRTYANQVPAGKAQYDHQIPVLALSSVRACRSSGAMRWPGRSGSSTSRWDSLHSNAYVWIAMNMYPCFCLVALVHLQCSCQPACTPT